MRAATVRSFRDSERTPEQRKAPIAASVANVGGWAKALFEEPTRLAAFSSLNVPVLYMVGKDSPASSLGVPDPAPNMPPGGSAAGAIFPFIIYSNTIQIP